MQRFAAWLDAHPRLALVAVGVAGVPASRRRGTLLTTSLVFLGGFGTLVLSDMPMLRLLGLRCSAAPAAAFVGDLVILPAFIRVFGARGRRGPGPPAPGPWLRHPQATIPGSMKPDSKAAGKSARRAAIRTQDGCRFGR